MERFVGRQPATFDQGLGDGMLGGYDLVEGQPLPAPSSGKALALTSSCLRDRTKHKTRVPIRESIRELTPWGTGANRFGVRGQISRWGYGGKSGPAQQGDPYGSSGPLPDTNYTDLFKVEE